MVETKITCPNCNAQVFESAEICPVCECNLNEGENSRRKRKRLGLLLSRVSLISGLVMLISLFLTWVNLGEEFSKTCFKLSTFNVFFVLSLGIVAFSVQNLLSKVKRSLLIWLFALIALVLGMFFMSDLESRSKVLQEQYASSALVESNLQTEQSDLENSSKIVGIGVYFYNFGAIVVLIAMLVPTLLELVRKPGISIILILIGALFFLIYMQFINGNAYKILLKQQLDMQGYEVVEIKRIFNKSYEEIDKTFNFEIFAKRGAKNVSKDPHESAENTEIKLYFGVKLIRLGSLTDLFSLKLSEVNQVETALYPEFTAESEGADEDN